jgi:hypothetical protein
MTSALSGSSGRAARVLGVLVCAVGLALGAVAGCQSGGQGEDLPIAPATVPSEFSYADWSAFLSAVVTPDGYIKWNAVQTDEAGARKDLLSFIGLVNLVSPDNHPELFRTPGDRQAYWINAYNAMTCYGVVLHKYPASVMEGSPQGQMFSSDRFSFGGWQTTLWEFSRQRFSVGMTRGEDVRVFFALTQCAMSSPPMRSEPYDGAVLDAQLLDQGQRYLSDPRAVVRRGDTAYLNYLLYSKYRQEFIAAFEKLIGHPPSGILEALKPYAQGDSPIESATKPGELGFDWSLNRPPR